MTVIIGAGFSGLIAACMMPEAKIIEAANGPFQSHNALLRFRSDAVANATGIEFRKVRVHKAVFDGKEMKNHATIRDMNLYSKKVSGSLMSRSISSLEPSDRYVAPNNFYDRLIKRLDGRIEWGRAVNSDDVMSNSETPVISTIPMKELAKISGVTDLLEGQDFSFMNISVVKMKVLNCDLFQTYYDTDPGSSIYRASITGDTLIVESITRNENPATCDLGRVFDCFGIKHTETKELSFHDQKYGKINPINDRVRKSFMASMTQNLNVYSLGRFATWRNILLDDVVHDVVKIKSFIDNGPYEIMRSLSK